MSGDVHVRFCERPWGKFPRATHLVMTLEGDHSGKRMLAVLGKRLGRYGLILHATKTRYVDFRPQRRKEHEPDVTFDFLGFTHVWGRSRRGKSVVRGITAKSRFARAVKVVYDWCKRNRHVPLKQQQEHLSRVIRGHCGYYGLTGNSKRLSGFPPTGDPRMAQVAVTPSPGGAPELGSYERKFSTGIRCHQPRSCTRSTLLERT